MLTSETEALALAATLRTAGRGAAPALKGLADEATLLFAAIIFSLEGGKKWSFSL
jgi:hypothetical protein